VCGLSVEGNPCLRMLVRTWFAEPAIADHVVEGPRTAAAQDSNLKIVMVWETRGPSNLGRRPSSAQLGRQLGHGV
jgi:hypothetical protein